MVEQQFKTYLGQASVMSSLSETMPGSGEDLWV